MLVAPLVALGQPLAGLTDGLETCTVTVQLPLAGMVRPLKERLVAPAVNELPAAPVQVPPAAPVAKICIPVSASVKATEVSAAALLLARVMVSVDLLAGDAALVRMTPGKKPTDSCGGESTTRFAVLEAGPATGDSLLVTPEAVLLLMPELLLVTVTVTVQLPVNGMVSPEKFNVPVWPAAKLFDDAPAQLPPAAPAPLMLMLARVSVKLEPVRGTLLELASVKVRRLVPPCPIGLVAKALAMVAGAATMRRAVLETGPVAASTLESPEVLLG